MNEKELLISTDEILNSESQKLSLVIEKIQDLRSVLRRIDLESKHVAVKLTEEYESVKSNLAEIGATIEDPKIKVIVLDVLQLESNLSDARNLLESSSKIVVRGRKQIVNKTDIPDEQRPQKIEEQSNDIS